MPGTTPQGQRKGRAVVVVGGGLAGITAALACADAGARVTLVESRRVLGGAATSLRRDGLEVDVGQHVFLRCCCAYRWLLRRLDVTHLTELQRRMEIIVLDPHGRRGRLRRSGLPAPLHLAGALATYPYLTPRERWRAGLAALDLGRLDARDARLDGQSFGSWLTAQGQSADAVACLWNLIGQATLNLRADQASLLLAAKVFRTGLLERAAAGDIGVSRVPLARLHGEPAMAALRGAGVDVRLGDPVGALTGDGRGVESRAGTLEADAVVLAVPPRRAARLLPLGALPAPGALAGLGTSAIVSAHVVYDRPVMPYAFVAALDSPVQWAFERSHAAGSARGRYVVVTLSDAGDALREPVEVLRERLVPALARLFPAARRAHVERFLVTRAPAATFRGTPGSAGLRPGARTLLPGLYLAGAYTDTGWPDTMESAVRSGLRAAHEALSDVRPRAHGGAA